MDLTTLHFLSVDPGKTTGWAAWNLPGELLGYGQIRGLDDFARWLWSLDPGPAVIIYEDYRVDPRVPHGGSRVETVQVIGSIQSYGALHENCAVKPPIAPRYKKAGYAWYGMKPLPKSQHGQSHQYDAIAIGSYYLRKHGIRKSRLLDGKDG